MRRDESLELIERSMARIGRVGSSVAAARRRAATAGVDVSSPGMGVLGALVRGGPQRVSTIAATTGLLGSHVSRELRGLEAEGLVVRETDGRDARAVLVSVTPAGRAAYRRLKQASVTAADTALAGWRADELATLARLLDRMADDFTGGNGGAER
ncbi:MAG: MarR family winged helix-turn-helix transcriptional regulator [Acidimicrobiia bacterium]